MGNFNAIRIDSKRIGGYPRPLISMLEFNDCLDNDLQSSGHTLSWCNGHFGGQIEVGQS